MGQTTDEIESDIDQSREALQSNLEELETRVKDVTNWRSLVRRHPVPMFVAALAGGMLLSTLLEKR
jgi:archaellum component FlaC